MPRLTLTPEMLEGAYEYLRVSPPFCSWGLPHADQVMFRVLGARDRFGHFRGSEPEWLSHQDCWGLIGFRRNLDRRMGCGEQNVDDQNQSWGHDRKCDRQCH